MFFSKLYCLQNRPHGGIPSRAKQPCIWIRAKLQAWEWKNTASIWFIYPFCRKNLDQMVGVKKKKKWQCGKQGRESRHFLSPPDWLSWHAGGNKCIGRGLGFCFNYAVAISPCHQHNSISSLRDAPNYLRTFGFQNMVILVSSENKTWMYLSNENEKKKKTKMSPQ